VNPLAIILCTIISVHDADTFRCDNGVSVRLSGVAAPELRTPRGDAAAEWARSEWLGLTVVCEIEPRASFGRQVATCARLGDDLGAKAIGAGHARNCPAFGGRYRDGDPALPLPGYCR
jgi:endonuclease YncB( thermonuclease family)